MSAKKSNLIGEDRILFIMVSSMIHKRYRNFMIEVFLFLNFDNIPKKVVVLQQNQMN